MLHGEGNHSTEECKKLQQEAKRLKANDKKPDGNKFSKGQNWKSKAELAKTKTKNDLAVYIKRAVAAETKKANKGSKKRKSKDDDSVGSLAMVERLEDLELEDFNYTKLLDDEKSEGEVSC